MIACVPRRPHAGRGRCRQAGFTLVEMMLVVVVLGILFSIAIPTYSGHMTKARRADGKQMVMGIMQAEERFFANNLTYTTDLKNDLGYATATADPTVPSPEGFYLVTATACGGGIDECVLLTAVPQGKQSGDGNLTLNSRGTTTGKW